MLMGVLSSANVPVKMKLSSEFSGSADDGGFGLGSELPDCPGVQRYLHLSSVRMIIHVKYCIYYQGTLRLDWDALFLNLDRTIGPAEAGQGGSQELRPTESNQPWSSLFSLQ
jgi:hypothetical protein